MIDVLRASTTIVTALAHGAAGIRPLSTVAEARAAAAAIGPDAVLGGERGGVRIDGFALGNSPLEYTRDRVGGRPVVITTTNGTAALAACRDAAAILIGALVNRTAVAELARSLGGRLGVESVHLVCAGTDGMATEEDVLAAGAILAAAAGGADSPAAESHVADRLDDSCRLALAAYRAAAGDAGRDGDGGAAMEAALARALAASTGGRNLTALGMQDDLPAAAAIDAIPLVPRLERGSGWLHVTGA